MQELMNPLLTNGDVADRLKVSLKTVATLEKAGAFSGIRLTARTLRYDVDDIAAFIARSREGDPLEWPDAFGAEIAAATGERIPQNTYLLRVKDVCEWLGIGDTTAWRWVDEGRLPVVKLRPMKITRFDAADVQALVESRRPDQIGAMPALEVSNDG